MQERLSNPECVSATLRLNLWIQTCSFHVSWNCLFPSFVSQGLFGASNLSSVINSRVIYMQHFFFSSLPPKMFKNKQTNGFLTLSSFPVYVNIKILLFILAVVRLLKCVKYIYPSIAFNSSDQQLYIQLLIKSKILQAKQMKRY